VTREARTAVKTVLGIAAAFAAFVVAVTVFSRDDTYTLKLALDDAAGLRDGSPVSIGGVRVGKVELKLGDGDKVHVDLNIDKGKRVPKDARVGISAVNFLGQKQVAFSGGNPADPAPDGYVIPAARVTTSTDLDQVLGALDNDTRTRLSILVNEAGAAVAGRQWDISRDIQQLPTTLVDAHTLLSQLVDDNHTLADLVTSSDRFIGAATAKRADLNQLIDKLGQTSQTVETKRAELGATLAKAPRTLATMQRFFAQLERTTVPLGPAARAITATAPALDDTLSRVESFRKSADPTLNTATALAPTLTRLGTQATPVIRQAQPTVKSLAQLAPAAAPLADALDHSADNLVGTVENWSQAIQLRDGMSHIFRGEATFSPDLVTSVIDRLVRPAAANAEAKAPARKGDGKQAAGAPAAPKTPGAGAPAADAKPAAPANPVKSVVDGVGKTVKDVLNGLLGPKSGGAQAAPPASGSAPDTSAESLLDFLLGP
jgi:virulence factor Mce-like protein